MMKEVHRASIKKKRFEIRLLSLISNQSSIKNSRGRARDLNVTEDSNTSTTSFCYLGHIQGK